MDQLPSNDHMNYVFRYADLLVHLRSHKIEFQLLLLLIKLPYLKQIKHSKTYEILTPKKKNF